MSEPEKPRIALDERTFAAFVETEPGKKTLRLTTEDGEGKETSHIDLSYKAFLSLLSMVFPEAVMPVVRALLAAGSIELKVVDLSALMDDKDEQDNKDDEFVVPPGAFVAPFNGREH